MANQPRIRPAGMGGFESAGSRCVHAQSIAGTQHRVRLPRRARRGSGSISKPFSRRRHRMTRRELIDIHDRLVTSEIAMILASDPGWRLPSGCWRRKRGCLRRCG